MSEKEERKLKESRIIFLNGRIDEKKAKEINEKLLLLEWESPIQDIYFYIDSYGGYVDSTFSIIDVMNLISCDVQTICIGKAMSGAAMVLATGTKGKRFITPNSRVMIHQVWSFSFGSASEIEIEAKEIKRLQQKVETLLVKTTGQKLNQIRKDLTYLRYMTAKEAVDYGLVDAIMNSRERPK